MTNGLVFYAHDGIDLIFEEKGNAFSAIRKIQWAKEGDEPDPERGKLEIRKWYASPDGERPGKGFTFQSEEGIDELSKTLVENGYGDTKDLLLALKKREDFKYSVDHLNDIDEEEDDGEYFDAREALLA